MKIPSNVLDSWFCGSVLRKIREKKTMTNENGNTILLEWEIENHVFFEKMIKHSQENWTKTLEDHLSPAEEVVHQIVEPEGTLSGKIQKDEKERRLSARMRPNLDEPPSTSPSERDEMDNVRKYVFFETFVVWYLFSSRILSCHREWMLQCFPDCYYMLLPRSLEICRNVRNPKFVFESFLRRRDHWQGYRGPKNTKGAFFKPNHASIDPYPLPSPRIQESRAQPTVGHARRRRSTAKESRGAKRKSRRVRKKAADRETGEESWS